MATKLDAWLVRQLAVEAGADPRSVAKQLTGRPVRGYVGHRIRQVLMQHGLLPGARPAEEAPR